MTIIGLVIGGALVGLAGGTIYSERHSTGDYDFSILFHAPAGACLGAILGAVVAAVIA